MIGKDEDLLPRRSAAISGAAAQLLLVLLRSYYWCCYAAIIGAAAQLLLVLLRSLYWCCYAAIIGAATQLLLVLYHGGSEGGISDQQGGISRSAGAAVRKGRVYYWCCNSVFCLYHGGASLHGLQKQSCLFRNFNVGNEFTHNTNTSSRTAQATRAFLPLKRDSEITSTGIVDDNRVDWLLR